MRARHMQTRARGCPRPRMRGGMRGTRPLQRRGALSASCSPSILISDLRGQECDLTSCRPFDPPLLCFVPKSQPNPRRLSYSPSHWHSLSLHPTNLAHSATRHISSGINIGSPAFHIPFPRPSTVGKTWGIVSYDTLRTVPRRLIARAHSNTATRQHQ